jgi:hypothetical protein
MSVELDTHLSVMIAQLKQGRVVPFLGAGANLIGRRKGTVWNADERQQLPSGAELAAYLADLYEYRSVDRENLVRVAEYIALTAGSGPLYEALRELFDADYPLTPLHSVLAQTPALLQHKGYPPLQLVVTTNYDDLLERAFGAEGQAVDVVSYMTIGDERGRFVHFPPEGEPRLIEQGHANEYTLDQDERGRLVRPAILKIHGAVDRLAHRRDSFVITEDDYIDYLTRTDISSLVPVTMAEKLKKANFLFLGYSLRDWNLRAILHRIWSGQREGYRSWAILRDPDRIEEKAWEDRGVELLNLSLDEYVAALRPRLESLATKHAVHNA